MCWGGGCNQKEKPESLGHLMGYFSGSTLSNGLAVTCNMVYIPLLTPKIDLTLPLIALCQYFKGGSVRKPDMG